VGKDAAVVERSRQGSKDLSEFLKEHYGRRLWDAEFTAKATDPRALQERLERSIRTLVYDAHGKLTASGTLIFSPYLKLRLVDSATSQNLPWMNLDQLAKHLESHLGMETATGFQLPVESFFNVQFARQATGAESLITINGKDYFISQGFLVEMASYAVNVASPVRQAAAEELYYEFLLASYVAPFALAAHENFHSSIVSQMSHPSFDKTDFFYSYGEAVGQRLYRPFGFSPIKELQTENHGVTWAPLSTGADLHPTYVQARGLEDVAKRVFDEVMLLGLGVHSGRDWLYNSMAEDLTFVNKEAVFRARFFEKIEPQLKEKFEAVGQ
jgi:hypothetical protein